MMRSIRILADKEKLSSLAMEKNIFVFCILNNTNLVNLKERLKNKGLRIYYLSSKGLKSIQQVSGGRLLIVYSGSTLVSSSQIVSILELEFTEDLELLFLQEGSKCVTISEYRLIAKHLSKSSAVISINRLKYNIISKCLGILCNNRLRLLSILKYR